MDVKTTPMENTVDAAPTTDPATDSKGTVDSQTPANTAGGESSQGGEAETLSQKTEAILGIDIGSDTAVLSLLDLKTVKPDILRNDISNQKTPVFISFHENQRSFGDAAKQLQTAYRMSTFAGFIRAIGRSPQAFQELTPFFTARSSGENKPTNKEGFPIDFKGEQVMLSAVQLLAMFISKVYAFALPSSTPAPTGEEKAIDAPTKNIDCCLVIPECFGVFERNCVFAACELAEVPCSQLIHRTTAAAVTNATRKVSESLHEQNVMYVDIGHGYASVAVFTHLNPSASEREVVTIASRCDETLGSCMIDAAIYSSLVEDCKERYKQYGEDAEIKQNSKGGIRLLAIARKLKETLSGVTEATATCENLVGGQDVRFSFTRDKLERACEPLKQKLVALFTDLLTECREKNVVVTACELIGGGMRVPFVKAAIEEAIQASNSEIDDEDQQNSVELSYTLDSMASNCIGGSYLLAKKYEPEGAIRRPIYDTIAAVRDNVGVFTRASGSQEEKEEASEADSQSVWHEGELERAKQLQQDMAANDEKIRQTNEARNALEAFIFETRSAANGGGKHAALIKKEACLKLVNEAEEWLYEEGEARAELGAKVYLDKLVELKGELEPSCGEYLRTIEAEERKKEEELKALSKQAAEDLEKSGGKDDHDFRKLSKPDRMKKVMMNKNEGTSLFKDGNYEPASLRYKRALQHCEKFFDMSKEDEKEIEGIKHSLYLNLALCLIKTEKLDEAMRNLNNALEMNETSTKALYRRAVVYEKTKEYQKAKQDLLKLEKLHQKEAEEAGDKEVKPDKAVEKLLQRVELQIKRQKAKQKKMAQRMFA